MKTFKNWIVSLETTNSISFVAIIYDNFPGTSHMGAGEWEGISSTEQHSSGFSAEDKESLGSTLLMNLPGADESVDS